MAGESIRGIKSGNDRARQQQQQTRAANDDVCLLAEATKAGSISHWHSACDIYS